MREDESHFWMVGNSHCAALHGKSTEQSSLEYFYSDCSQDSFHTLSSVPASPSAPSGSKASSFLEYSQLGRLSVGWQDSPDIVALFLSGQLEKYESSTGNISFFDENHEALFRPPEFEMKTSFLLVKDKSLPRVCVCAHVCTSESKPSDVPVKSPSNHHNRNLSCIQCHKISLTALKENLEQLHIDVKMASVENISQCVQEVGGGMEMENSYLGENSQCLQMEGDADGETSCTNVSEFSSAIVGTPTTTRAPPKQNLFSTTIISAPEIVDSSTQLPFSPLSREQDMGVKPKISCKETGFDIDSPSSLHTASTPSKTSKASYSKATFKQQHFTPTPQSSSGRCERSSNAEKCDLKDKFPFVDQSTMNPFDSCTDSLQMPTVSPSLFKEVISPHSMNERSTDFRWSIEQMALLNPAHIELTSPQSYCDSPHDLEYEKRAQEAIEKFFSRRCVLPSPWTNSVPKSRFTDQSDRCKYSIVSNSLHTPRSAESRSGGQHFMSPSVSNNSTKFHGVSVACQTNLSLPAVLPPHVESLLSLHSQSVKVSTSDSELEDLTTLSNTSLRRRLLFNSEEGMSSPSLKNSMKTPDENIPKVVATHESLSPSGNGDDKNKSNQTEPSLDHTVVSAIPAQNPSPTTRGLEQESVSPIHGSLPQSSVDFEFEFKDKSNSLKEGPHYGPMCSLSPIDEDELNGPSNRNHALPSSPNLSPIKFNLSLCEECNTGDCWCKKDVSHDKSDRREFPSEGKDESDVSSSRRSLSKFSAEETNSAHGEDIDAQCDGHSKIPSLVEADLSSFSPVIVSSLNYDRLSPISHSATMDFKHSKRNMNESQTLLSSKSSGTTFLTASSTELCPASDYQIDASQSSRTKLHSDASSSSEAMLHSAMTASQCSSAAFRSFEPTSNSEGTDDLLSLPNGCMELQTTSPSSHCELASNEIERSTQPADNVS